MIERIGSIRRFTTDEPQVRFDATNLLDSWGALSATLSVYCDADGHRGLITTERIAIVKGGERQSLAKRLHSHPNNRALGIGADTWTRLVEEACHELLKDHLRPAESVQLTGEFPADNFEQFLFAPFLLGGAVPTSLFGEGGSGKSWLALAIAASVSHGLSFIEGIEAPSRCVPVLWLDYENDERELRSRSARLTGGTPLAGLFYVRGSGSLADQADGIAARVAELGAGLVVVDSITGATGGADLNDNNTATRLHGALRQLNCPVLLIAHTAKNTRGGGIFGAVAFRDLSRLVWSVEKSDGGSHIVIKDTKRNASAKSPDIGLLIDFEVGERGTVRLSRTDIADLPDDLARGLRVRDQVLVALQGQALSRDQLAERVDAKRGTLNTTLARLVREQVVRLWDDNRYSLSTTTNDTPTTPTVVGGGAVVSAIDDSRTTGRQLSSSDLQNQTPESDTL
jgi:hypothetical protein